MGTCGMVHSKVLLAAASICSVLFALCLAGGALLACGVKCNAFVLQVGAQFCVGVISGGLPSSQLWSGCDG
jgi:hypothetical protein